jgi:hypothetical protein
VCGLAGDADRLYWHLVALVAALLRFLAPAFYCRAWSPWLRIVSTACVVVVVVIVVQVGVPFLQGLILV